MSGLATFFSVLIGVPFAFFTTRYKLPGATALRTLGTLPLILPTFIGAEAWLLLLGRNGIITRFFADLGLHIPSIYGWQGVVLVFTLQFFPFVFLMVGAAINSVDRSLEEAARNLGASPWRVFRTVTLPVVTPAIASGALIVFCMSIENFGVPTIIGNDYKVLAEQAYSEFVSEMGGQPFHGGHAEHRAGGGYPGPHRAAEAVGGTKKLRHVRAAPAGNQNPAPPGQGAGLGLLRPCRLYFPGALCHGHGGGCDQNQRTVLYYGQFTLDNLLIALKVAPRPILNSFFLSTTATVIGMVFGLAVSYLVVRKGGVIGYALDLAMMLPLVIAGSVLGIALAATYNTGPVVLTGTWMIIVLAYFIRKTPFSVKTTSALLRQIEVSVEEASISLGVPPLRTFLKVVVPAMLPGVAAGAIIMWVTTLAELELHHRPLLRTVEHHDRTGLSVYRAPVTFGPASGLRGHPHRFRTGAPVYSQQGAGQGSDHLAVRNSPFTTAAGHTRRAGPKPPPDSPPGDPAPAPGRRRPEGRRQAGLCRRAARKACRKTSASNRPCR